MKKTIGIIMIIIGAILVIPNMVSFIRLVNHFTMTAKANSAYEWGYFMGKASVVLLWMAVNVFLFIYGIRFVRKPINKDSDPHSFEDSFHSNNNP